VQEGRRQMIRCVALDDYQNAARGMADWGAISSQVELTVIPEHLPPDAMVAGLQGAEIVVAMRERSRFDAAVLARLPALRLLVTTGMVNAAIDLDAARARGIIVCGTTSRPHPTPELAWGLLMALARHIPQETAAFHAGLPPWQHSVGVDLAGKVLGLVGLGAGGAAHGALRRRLRNAGAGLEPQPDRRARGCERGPGAPPRWTRCCGRRIW
jgi:phosphoglycerate dehydrogenase-like enzyme